MLVLSLPLKLLLGQDYSVENTKSKFLFSKLE